MQSQNITLVYFSATSTTRRVVREIAKHLPGDVTEHDITQVSAMEEVQLGKGDLLVVGMPVYAGRIPANSLNALNSFKGDGTPTVIVCVYGNRDYDDALLELKDIVEANGFKAVSAGAFIAQHSIFPQVGVSRPDEKDMALITEFATTTAGLLSAVEDPSTLSEIVVKGNRPYKNPGKIPLQPKGDKKCNECGSCVKLCPVQAIPEDNPRKTHKDICIACGRCIVICPQNARHFGGLVYKLAKTNFVKANSERKEPSVVYSTQG